MFEPRNTNRPAPSWYGSDGKAKKLWGKGGLTQNEILKLKQKSHRVFSKYFVEVEDKKDKKAE